MSKTDAVLAAFLLVPSIGAPSLSGNQDKYATIAFKDAAEHEGEIVWVEGTVLRTEKAGEGTYLLFSANEKYLRVLIPTKYMSNFEGSIHHRYAGRKIKAIGKIQKVGTGLILGINEPKRIEVLESETQ